MDVIGRPGQSRKEAAQPDPAVRAPPGRRYAPVAECIRTELKLRRPKGHVGSIPTRGTVHPGHNDEDMKIEIEQWVRDLETDLVGRVVDLTIDNSCSDPGCCGGPWPDTAYIAFECGHVIDVGSDRDGDFGRFDLASEPTDRPEHKPVEGSALRTVRDGLTVKERATGLSGVVFLAERVEDGYVWARLSCGHERYFVVAEDGSVPDLIVGG